MSNTKAVLSHGTIRLLNCKTGFINVEGPSIMIQTAPLSMSTSPLEAMNVVVDYIVLTKSDPSGASACIPGLPGCWSEGATDDEALSLIPATVADLLSDAAEISLRRSSGDTHTLSVSFR
jgi:predicted RNase H-like HicB family nuclease